MSGDSTRHGTVEGVGSGQRPALHCHCTVSLSGLARPQSTSTAWDRLVSTF